jgi:hypothetical protein
MERIFPLQHIAVGDNARRYQRMKEKGSVRTMYAADFLAKYGEGEEAKTKLEMHTGNDTFDRAVAYLSEFHSVFDLACLPAIDLRTRPKGLRTDKAWRFYADALISVLTIGLRNGWITLQQDGQGYPLFIRFNVCKEVQHETG